MKKLRYSCEVLENTVKIFINDILHVVIKQDEVIGLQSWISGEKRKLYHIEYYFRQNGYFYSEYDCYDKWKNILGLLNTNIELNNDIK